MNNRKVISQSILIFLLSLGLGIFFIYSIEDLREAEVRAAATLIANSHALSLERELSRSLSAPLALATILKQNKSIPNFEAVAEDLIQRYGGISSLQLAPKAIVSKIYPLQGNEPAIGHDLSKKPKAISAIESKQLVLEGPIDLIQGGTAVLGRYPVFLNNTGEDHEKFWGFTTVLIELSKLLEAVDVKGLISNNYHFELSRTDSEGAGTIVFSKSSNQILDKPVSVDIKIPSDKWTLAVAPKSGWHSTSTLGFEAILVLFASSASALLGYFHFKRTEELVVANKLMTYEISQRRKIEDELKRSNQALNEFAAIASHDLRAPLRRITSFASFLAENKSHLNEKELDYLERISKSADRMQDFINNLLDYSCISSSDSPFVNTSLTQVVNDVLIDLEVDIKKLEGQVEVSALPTLCIDKWQFNQLFLNLISNCLKFCRKDNPPRVKISSRNIDNGFWEISIEDNGIGFSNENAKRIFKPFERLHGSSTHKGTGIGLAICKKVVERHGGSITAKSLPGEGSTFTMTLPNSAQES